MTVYVGPVQPSGFAHLMADTEDEGARFTAGLALPAGRLRLAGTPRWHWLLTPDEADWAQLQGAREVDVEHLRGIVAARAAALEAQERAELAETRGRRRPRYNPATQLHSWDHPREHHYVCWWCGLLRVKRPPGPDDRGRWWEEWRWPNGSGGSSRSGARLPRCPGPPAGGPVGAGNQA